MGHDCCLGLYGGLGFYRGLGQFLDLGYLFRSS